MLKPWTHLVCVLLYLSATSCEKETFMIGAIFELRGDEQPYLIEKAVQTAVREINESEDYDFQFEAIIEYIQDDPYEALSATCRLLEKDIVGIFGPFQEDNSNVVQAISDEKEIPHIEVRWDDHPLHGTIVNVHPHPDVLTKTYLDIIEKWGWRDFVILYENDEGLKRVGELLKVFEPTHHRIVVRQLREEYRTILKELWRSGATHFVLDCTVDTLPEVLLHAQQVGLMTNKQHYIITNLDLHTIDLNSYRYSETNITGMRFFDPEDSNVMKVAAEIYDQTSGMELLASWKLRLEEALMYDAVMMFAETIKEGLPMILKKREMSGIEAIQEEREGSIMEWYPLDLSCHNDNPFSSGMSLVNIMKILGNEYEGLTGKIKYDRYGLRSEFSLNITELREGGVTNVGKWNSSDSSRPLTITREVVEDNELSIKNQSFTVIITLLEPFGMRKISSENLQGNDRYEGFAVDIIHELSLLRGFNYTIKVMDSTGREDPVTGKWTGIIGALHDREGDLAITDLTITFEREAVVDFTSPFMTLGIGILYQKPTEAPPSFFSFADPLAFEVWRLLIVAWVGVSFILFIVGRISPSEWENPYPCIEEPEYLVNQLDLRNCAWFITGSIMQQGSEIELKSVSTRMVAGMWWFFTLLMVSSYTANLAAFLTTMTPDYHFKNFEELINNAEKKNIKYGAKEDGSTANFIRDKAKTEDIYRRAWEFMENNKDEVMVKNSGEGVAKAVNERYAFFMESSSIEYETQRKCTLQKVGDHNLDEKSYGIAMRKNETYRNSLSTGILMLQNSGKLEEIRRTWWEERRGGGQCKNDEVESEATPLDLKNVGGVFYVTLGGTILAFLLAMLETILHTFKKSVKTKTQFWPNLVEEVKFYFRFNELVKPVTQGTSSERSASHELTSQEKSLPYDLVDKQASVETLDSYASNKSKKNKKNKKEYKRQSSNITC